MTNQQHIRKVYHRHWEAIDPRRITQDFAHAAKGMFPLFERGAHAFDKVPQPGERQSDRASEGEDSESEGKQNEPSKR